jgi:hypothetical protein
MNSKIFYQAVLCGIVFILLGLILSVIFEFLKPQLPADCEIWDKYYVMEVSLFFSGFIFRYILSFDNLSLYLNST